MTSFDKRNYWTSFFLARTQVTRAPPPEPCLGVEPNGEHLVLPAPMWPDQAQSNEAKWVPIPMGSPPVGGPEGQVQFELGGG